MSKCWTVCLKQYNNDGSKKGSPFKCECVKCDTSRIVSHRGTNCFCHSCIGEKNRLPPPQTKVEEIDSYNFEAREARKAMRKAKREVRDGKQARIEDFFGGSNKPKKKKRKTVAKAGIIENESSVMTDEVEHKGPVDSEWEEGETEWSLF